MAVEEPFVDALLSASRAMVALAARSLNRVDADVTLQQYRTLVVLATFGQQPSAEVARRLAVAPSTVTRMCDRLVRKELIRRFHREDDRRLVWLGLTERGRDLVGEVMRARQDEIAALVQATGLSASDATVRDLIAFTVAVGEVPDPLWWNALRTSADPLPGIDFDMVDLGGGGRSRTIGHGSAMV